MNFTPKSERSSTQSVSNNENYRQIESRPRENSNHFASFLLGSFVTIFIGIIAGASFFFYFNQRNSSVQTPDSASKTVTPQQPQKETKIIERAIEKTQEIVPIPQVKESEKTQETAPEPQEEPASEEAQPKAEIQIPENSPLETPTQPETTPTENDLE